LRKAHLVDCEVLEVFVGGDRLLQLRDGRSFRAGVADELTLHEGHGFSESCTGGYSVDFVRKVVGRVGVLDPWPAERPARARGEIDAECEASTFCEHVLEVAHPGWRQKRNEPVFVATNAINGRDLKASEAVGGILLHLGRQRFFVANTSEPPPAGPRLHVALDGGPGWRTGFSAE
jgi:hypothetical protein